MKVQENKEIKDALLAQWKSSKITKYSQIAYDASKRAKKIWDYSEETWAQCLSRYLHGNFKKGSLTESMLLWLAERWNIEVITATKIKVLKKKPEPLITKTKTK